MADKMTKIDWYNEIKMIVLDSENEKKGDILCFIDKQIEQIQNKASRARSGSAKNNAAPHEWDILKKEIYNTLADEPKCIDEIAEAVANVDFKDITRAKVSARLNQLLKDSYAEKITVSVGETGSKRKLVAYALGEREADFSEENAKNE